MTRNSIIEAIGYESTQVNEEFEKKREYDFSKILNIYEVMDKEREVRDTFLYFLKSVKDIFSFEGRSRTNNIKSANDYCYFISNVMDMNKKVRMDQAIEQEEQEVNTVPTKFIDLLLIDEHNKTGMMRKEADLAAATQEIVQMLSTYMAHKYKQHIKIGFDSLFFMEQYTPEDGLFDIESYSTHIKNLKEDATVPLPDFVIGEGKPGGMIYGNMVTEWLDGTTVEQLAKVDLATGEIVEKYNDDNEIESNSEDNGLGNILKDSESSEIFIKAEYFEYEGVKERVKLNYHDQGKSSLVDPSNIIFKVNADNREKAKEGKQRKREKEQNKQASPKMRR